VPLDPAQLEIFTLCTGRSVPLLGGLIEAWLIVGRRGAANRSSGP
jgi:hypothetical protein